MGGGQEAPQGPGGQCGRLESMVAGWGRAVWEIVRGWGTVN